jgi:hypothetical protein
MIKDKALKMAIEALEQAKKQLTKYWDEDIKRGYYIEEMDDSPILLCGDAINACKEALEQPAQEPVATIQQFERKWIEKEALEQPNNERKSIMQPEIKLADGITVEEWHELREPKEQPAQEPVELIRNENGNYSPKREWQGLTDDEVEKLWKKFETELVGSDIRDWTHAIEQALKEKNK